MRSVDGEGYEWDVTFGACEDCGGFSGAGMGGYDEDGVEVLDKR